MNKVTELYIKSYCPNSIEAYALLKSFDYDVKVFAVNSPDTHTFQGQFVSHVPEHSLMLTDVPHYPIAKLDGKLIIGLKCIKEYITRD
jgi:hypothetical protein